jgi:hypothetical protein
VNQPEAQDPRDNQKNRYDVIEQLRHDQDEDAGNQRDNRLKVCDANGHFPFPALEASAASQTVTL